MLAQAEDHLVRATEALGSHPGVAAILLTNVRRSGPDESPLLPAPLHHGEVDAGTLIELDKNLARA